MGAQNHIISLGPIQTCKSGPKVAVLYGKKQRWGVKPIETSISGANHAGLYAQNDKWGQVPI